MKVWWLSSTECSSNIKIQFLFVLLCCNSQLYGRSTEFEGACHSSIARQINCFRWNKRATKWWNLQRRRWPMYTPADTSYLFGTIGRWWWHLKWPATISGYFPSTLFLECSRYQRRNGKKKYTARLYRRFHYYETIFCVTLRCVSKVSIFVFARLVDSISFNPVLGWALPSMCISLKGSGDLKFKLVTVGDSGVGKSCLLARFVQVCAKHVSYYMIHFCWM